MYLGIHGDRSVTIGEIASRHGISRNHVMKVVHELGQLGYLQTIRGKNGGIRLGRLPEQINVGRRVRETERNLELLECCGPDPHCRIASPCSVPTPTPHPLSSFFASTGNKPPPQPQAPE